MVRNIVKLPHSILKTTLAQPYKTRNEIMIVFCHFCTFSLPLNSINCDHKSLQKPIENNDQMKVCPNNKLKQICQQVCRLFVLLLLVLLLLLCFQRSPAFIITCISKISKEPKCVRFKAVSN